MGLSDPKITVKVTVPYKSFEEAQDVAKKITEAMRELASYSDAKKAKIVFVKVEE